MGKLGRYDGEMVNGVRAALIERYKDRLAPIVANGNTVTGFQDPEFVRAFGVGLSRVSDSMLLSLSMKALVDKIASGESIPYFDDEPGSRRTDTGQPRRANRRNGERRDGLDNRTHPQP